MAIALVQENGKTIATPLKYPVPTRLSVESTYSD